jgi:MoxR-like ATPase
MADRTLRYRRLFDPRKPRRQKADNSAPAGAAAAGFGDQRRQAEYVYTEQIVLAVNVALATARPLLVHGSAGSGKSSLAADIARCVGWEFYAEVISSRTQARDLLWTFDAVRRLRDAQARLPLDQAKVYVRPGILWRAFDPEGAADYSAGEGGASRRNGVVVLLDEIDKAEPDTPNDLLVPLGTGTFHVTEVGLDVTLSRARRPLVVITTNEERELPSAFTRRCVVLRLPEPDGDWLTRVAVAHFGAEDQELYHEVARYVMKERARAAEEGQRPPSTAEFLDALQACRELRVRPGTPAWDNIVLATLAKWSADRDAL